MARNSMGTTKQTKTKLNLLIKYYQSTKLKLMPAQQHYGSSMGTNANGEQNHLEGLLPPTLEATGSLVAGKDIEKL